MVIPRFFVIRDVLLQLFRNQFPTIVVLPVGEFIMKQIPQLKTRTRHDYGNFFSAGLFLYCIASY